MQREIWLDHCWAPTSGAQPHCGGAGSVPPNPPPASASSDISMAGPIFTASLLSIVRSILMRRGGTKQVSTGQPLGRGSNGKEMLVLLWGGGDSG